MGFATWKRAQKTALTTKQDMTLKQLCGSLEISTLRKEKTIDIARKRADGNYLLGVKGI
jgi:hypothetical protein